MRLSTPDVLYPELVQAREGKVGAMGGSRTPGLVELLLFDLRVRADTFGILVKGQGL